MKKNKKAVSPVVATVLLIMIVIIIAIIILMWSYGFVKEVIEKDIAGKNKRVQQWCSEIGMKSIVNEDEYGFENTGSVPIFAYKVKRTEDGSSTIEKETGSVNPGYTQIIPDADGKVYNDYEEIKIIPILLGKKKKSGQTQEFECPERNGVVL